MHTLVNIQAVCQRLFQNHPKTDMMLCSRINDLVQRSIPDSSRRIIQHPLKSLLIIRIYRQTEVRYNVFNLLALIKRKSSVNLIR